MENKPTGTVANGKQTTFSGQNPFTNFRMSVRVDGQEISLEILSVIAGGSVTFAKAPPKGALVEVCFEKAV